MDPTTPSAAPGPAPARRRAVRVAVVGAVVLGALAGAVVASLRDREGPASGATPAPSTTAGASRPSPVATPLDVHVLTPQGDDAYQADRVGSSAAVRAAPGNTAGNLRVAVTDPDATPSRDHETCATWSGPARGRTQPGLALRVRDGTGTSRAITLTSSVWAGVRWQWNVHLWEDGSGLLLGRQLLDLGVPGEGLDTLPWRMCARAVGDRVDLVVWPEARDRPDWSDPARSLHATLPPGWDAPGLPGWYVGHLVPDDQTSYTGLRTRPVEGGAPTAPGG
ncbi:hypothetical protein PO878_09995 [Iamia majanohamensis]|uniref:Uncharacterized protein n=1 Tax=Iamia majanohamensis TaxID=467976 RepID=A0AAE9YJ52_9ACTN|nr:hypothetical protein [Iamia majanohamensis]WCO69056.1 hypothetical protein PO878_09995 [Iamia majanohamensis]